jgi:DNA polymerase-3 subunit epsilon
MEPLAFVDLETTGCTAPLDRITEVGIVEVDDDGVREWSTLINPETPIPASIQSMTGITNEMVRDAPTFEEAAKQIMDRLKGKLFIAHNARFDYGFLKNSFRRVGIEFTPTVLCTVRLSRALFPEHRHHNLDALIERHGLVANGRHRALADAQLIHQFWNIVEASHPPERVKSVLKQLTARPSLPSNIDPAIIDQLPDTPGVYLFYGENSLPLYVGKAIDLKRRVLSHFAADHSSPKEMSLARQVRRIDWIKTGGEVGAFLKESALIKELQPTHNRQLRRSSELCTIALVDHGGGHMSPEIVHAGDIDFSKSTKLYGLFKTTRDATKTLIGLAAEYGLCHAMLHVEKRVKGKSCFGYQLKKCKGTCVGNEPLIAHSMRLVQGLTKLQLKIWPFDGPALLEEGDEVLVVDQWCFLGVAGSDDEVASKLETRRPQFDRDTYRILSKVVGKMRPSKRSGAYQHKLAFA